MYLFPLTESQIDALLKEYLQQKSISEIARSHNLSSLAVAWALTQRVHQIRRCAATTQVQVQ